MRDGLRHLSFAFCGLPAAYLMVVYLLHLEVVENGLYALLYSELVERLAEL